VLDRLFALETFGIKLGLENIRRLCDALNHPERTFTSLHIAGTNGKGSVTAMVHAALAAAGIRTGRYTSPHLTNLRERFVIDRTAVDDGTLETVATEILDCADRLRREGAMAAPPTFFEATTAIAFELFRRRQVTAAVIEVGLGGRFDATNVLEPPIGAITSIALDHQQHLGDTIEQIAFEKAGIIKAGMILVSGALPDGAARIIRRVAQERGARVVESIAGVHIDSDMREGRAHLTIETPHGRYGPLRLALRGEHQIHNAVVAVRVLEAAREAGLDVPEGAIVRGLETVEWPARLELITLANGREVLLDAAHNPEGAHALREYLARWHPDRPALVVSIMRDKDADAILRELMPVTSSVMATAADTPRAMPADELAARVTALDPTKTVRACGDVLTAVDAALDSSRVVCVAGSIFLAGAVRDHLERRDILH
jgi:dihydrofolate synthase/folylpolyglutamate synthase